jgi:hypothetical protein
MAYNVPGVSEVPSLRLGIWAKALAKPDTLCYMMLSAYHISQIGRVHLYFIKTRI